MKKLLILFWVFSGVSAWGQTPGSLTVHNASNRMMHFEVTGGGSSSIVGWGLLAPGAVRQMQFADEETYVSVALTEYVGGATANVFPVPLMANDGTTPVHRRLDVGWSDQQSDFVNMLSVAREVERGAVPFYVNIWAFVSGLVLACSGVIWMWTRDAFRESL